jgi:hypothetical protein
MPPLLGLMYLQDDLKNTFFAQYQIVQGNTAFCKVFLQEIPHLQTIYKLFLRQLSADAGDPFIRCQF